MHSQSCGNSCSPTNTHTHTQNTILHSLFKEGIVRFFHLPFRCKTYTKKTLLFHLYPGSRVQDGGMVGEILMLLSYMLRLWFWNAGMLSKNHTRGRRHVAVCLVQCKQPKAAQWGGLLNGFGSGSLYKEGALDTTMKLPSHVHPNISSWDVTQPYWVTALQTVLRGVLLIKIIF